MRLQGAGFEETCRLEDFDWSASITLDRRLLDAVFSLKFLDKHEHVLLVGPAGVGKRWPRPWASPPYAHNRGLRPQLHLRHRGSRRRPRLAHPHPSPGPGQRRLPRPPRIVPAPPLPRRPKPGRVGHAPPARRRSPGPHRHPTLRRHHHPRSHSPPRPATTLAQRRWAPRWSSGRKAIIRPSTAVHPGP